MLSNILKNKDTFSLTNVSISIDFILSKILSAFDKNSFIKKICSVDKV